MGLSIWHVLVMLVVLILVFGTSRIKNLGRDLGTALKDFRQSVNEDQLQDIDKVAPPAKMESTQHKS